ncbi:hypothetical protein [Allorhizocola rhizosphaerae]|uniref:hypothetical protein n=1 Tax=Allorhizocola rhizosphaerae TaxID=1872709 RepID=UPI0013C2F381|nr:hypothetical protein [Allorhizocola rhizosphaerae]
MRKLTPTFAAAVAAVILAAGTASAAPQPTTTSHGANTTAETQMTAGNGEQKPIQLYASVDASVMAPGGLTFTWGPGFQIRAGECRWLNLQTFPFGAGHPVTVSVAEVVNGSEQFFRRLHIYGVIVWGAPGGAGVSVWVCSDASPAPATPFVTLNVHYVWG